MKILVQAKVLEYLRDWDFWEAMAAKVVCVIACFNGFAGLALFSLMVTACSRIGLALAEAAHATSTSRHDLDSSPPRNT